MAGGFPTTTHTWLKPLYDTLNSPTGKPGFYGTSGIAQLATGTAGITGVTGAGGMTAFSMAWFNGGSGAYYTISDLVTALKNVGILKR